MSVIDLDPPDGVRERQLGALAGMLQLEKRARAARTPEELGFIAVNDTNGVSPYRQAIFWRTDLSRIQALSGLATPDRNAPFCVWLAGMFRAGLALENADKAHGLSAFDLPETEREYWAEYLPEQALWLPLLRPDKTIAGVLLLARDEAWAEAEINLLDYVIDAYAHAWAALVRIAPKARPDSGERKRASILLGLTIVVVLLSPVRQSVLAPAEIVARNPVIVRAPIDGVIEKVDVQPNQPVRAGQILASLDPRETRSKLEVSRQSLAVADAELRQAQELAVFDDKGKANLAVLQGRRAGQAAEVDYLQGVLARLDLSAPRSGAAIFDDASELVGKPVSTGERIMEVADPSDAELEIDLPVGDAIALSQGDEAELYLNVDAGSAVRARLERIGYRAGMMPDGVMAYRLKASFLHGDPRVRVGLKGTAKLYGRHVPLILYILRRPIAAARMWLGF